MSIFNDTNNKDEYISLEIMITPRPRNVQTMNIQGNTFTR